jgi:general L-amino acid transport system substrate-binding protein
MPKLGVTSWNVEEMKGRQRSQHHAHGYRRLFGQEDLGLSNDFAANVIAKIGNYGEIYDRYMGPDGQSFVLDRGLNRLWTDGGLIYAPPLR